MDRPLFSEMLGERRRELGYSVRQASRVLRLREDVLIAFEEGDFEHMPKSGYAQGMISSYARYLGLDANEVVAAYLDDYEAYKRSERRQRGQRRSGSNGSPSRSHLYGERHYTGTRGLLPTSGGLAGDMGSFATTRVRTRYDSYADAGEDEFDELEDTQARPYTGRIPARSRRPYSTSVNRGQRDIETMSVDGYDDDLRIGRDAQGFETAASRASRRQARATRQGANRPRVNRRSGSVGSTRSSSGRSASRSGRGGGRSSLFGGGSSRMAVIAVAVVAILITIIMVFSIVSCINPNTGETKTVPVTSADETKKETNESTSNEKTETEKKDDKTESASTTTTSTTSTTKPTTDETDSSSEQETSVSVSVADGAVTWLEVECDGKSDVAETVTGPWQKTYTVEDALTVQAGDTTAVSVVQNGRQVQFESMASGIGSIRIQGTKKKTSNSDKDAKNNSSSDTTSDGTSAKTGNASSSAEKENASNADSTNQDAYGSENGYGNDEYYGNDYGYSGGY